MIQNVAIVLAMHGTPPKDFPKAERAELFALRAGLRHGRNDSKETAARHDALDEKMRRWPRTEENDPFYFGSQDLADHLSRKTGCRVMVGFNEFCGPTLDEAIDRALEINHCVIVTTPMMTRGGEHSKTDIPAAIARGKQRHPEAKIHYAWPFPVSDIAGFLAAQIVPFLS